MYSAGIALANLAAQQQGCYIHFYLLTIFSFRSTMRFLSVLLAGVIFLFQPTAIASPASDNLGVCLKDKTTVDDRKELVRWVFASLSAHPDIASMGMVTEQTRIQSNKAIAAILTRLLTENCVTEARAIIGTEGWRGMEGAFRSLSEMAMTELMAHPSIDASFGSYAQFLDMEKFETVLRK